MYKYKKFLPYPLKDLKKDLRMAKLLVTQFGGSNGELGAAVRYFSQKFSMPDTRGEALLNDIATEELGHAEMVASMVRMMLKDATIKEIRDNNLDGYFVEHGKGVYPVDASGVPFNSTAISSSSDCLANLAEDMAAEEKARATYENLIDLTNDPNLIKPLLFLRQREIVHYNRFKELYEIYKNEGY